MHHDWEGGLFSCFSHPGISVVTYFAPCYTYGKNAEATGDSCLLHGCLFFVPVVNLILPAFNRLKIRTTHSIKGSLLADLAVHWCCPCCALIQERVQVTCSGGRSGDSKAYTPGEEAVADPEKDKVSDKVSDKASESATQETDNAPEEAAEAIERE